MFSKDVVKMKRDSIAGIIRELGTAQNPGKSFNFPNLIFAPTQGSGYTDDEDDSEDYTSSSSGFGKSFSSNASSSTTTTILSGGASKTLGTPVKVTSTGLTVTAGTAAGSKSALVCIPIKRPGGGPSQLQTSATKLLANNTKITPVQSPSTTGRIRRLFGALKVLQKPNGLF